MVRGMYELASDLMSCAHSEDPVKGPWVEQPESEVTVWTDASSIAMGVVLQEKGTLLEYASWFSKKSDSLQINAVELEALGRGINLAFQWGFRSFTVATDSLVDVSWLDNTTEGRDRVHTKWTAQMLI